MDHDIERVVDLVDPTNQHLYHLTLEAARERLREGAPDAVRGLKGSFALTARAGKTVRMARSLDRPMRYFLAKRADGPRLVAAERIDVLRAWLEQEGLG